MSNSNNGAHILVFPFPAQGHMLPLLDLTHQLVLRGLTITILITPKNLPILTPLLSTHPSSIQTLVLPFPSHPAVPAGAENVKELGGGGSPGMISALKQLSDPITRWFKSHSSPPIAIISDFFLGWTQQLASQLGVPRINFLTSGALLSCVFNYLWVKREFQPSDVVLLPDVPNSPSFPFSHIPSMIRRYRKSDPVMEIVKDGMIANISSWGTVYNTFDAIESVYLDHLKKGNGHNRVWAVGPISLLGSDGAAAAERGGPNSASAIDVFSWLDGCSDGSVVYVCFGSQVKLTRDQMEGLAKGLEESGTKFILAVKAETYTPSEFEDRVAGRGFVIKGWAPQVRILSHRSVGAFLTHCGWNSVLEGIVAGVMLFAWPMQADQFINAKLLVDDMRVAIRVCEGAETVPDSFELARFLAGSMCRGSEKARALELREKALTAVKEGGSSIKDLDGFAEELCGLNVK